MSFHSWITSSFVRHFPLTPARRSKGLDIGSALNEQSSFQVGVRADVGDPQRVNVLAEGPAGWSVRVRRVGYVPVRHHNTPLLDDPADTDGLGHIPGYVPDPLFDENSLLLPAGETHAFWITVKPGSKAAPGDYAVKIKVMPETGKEVEHVVNVRLHDVLLRKRKNFPVTHWFYNDALIDWYKTDLFDRRYWKLLSAYVRNLVEHGQDTIYTPVFTQPTDGVKRPTQLLRIKQTGADLYSFDWRDVRKYVKEAGRCGIEFFEWSHFFTQWGVKNAIRIYEGQGREEKLLWRPSTGATSQKYRSFLGQFLPRFHRFLSVEKLLDKSFFHVSDEPHGAVEPYRKARALLKELAPWMNVMDALSEIEFGRQKITDMPVPSIRKALDFAGEGIPSWCYYCCGPRGRYLQHLLDTPLPKIAMHGFLFYRWPFHGFLHWGYNYWYEGQTRDLTDPFHVQDGHLFDRGWAYGDTSYVYPGPKGPIDSIRWEVFAEALQDYALLQTLGVERTHKVFAQIRSFEDFPKTEKWRRHARSAIFAEQMG